MPSNPLRTASPRPALPGASPNAPGQDYGWGPGWANQLQSGFQGFQDNVTMGGGDQLYAALAANPFSEGWYDRYSRNIDNEHRRDKWLAQHYGTARTLGKVAGVMVPMGVAGKVETGVQFGRRIVQATQALAREKAVLGGAGAAIGMGSQSASDWMTGHRSSVGDYVGSGLGGALEAYLLLSGQAGRAGTIGAGATSILQDALNGRLPSIGKAADNATTGGYTGVTFGMMGRKFAQNLSRMAKAELGEALSKARTLVGGDTTASTAKKRLYLDGKTYTQPDQRTARGQYVEAKLGLSARLSKNQRQAYKRPDLDYRVDHWLPRDVGAAVTFPSVQFSYQAADAKRQHARSK